MKIKKTVDAEMLKETFRKLGDSRAVKIVEEMQGYKRFYAFICDRQYGPNRKRTVEELEDWQVYELVSVLGKDEADARKRIKSTIDEQHEWGKRESYNWGMTSIKFVSEEYTRTAKFVKKTQVRGYGRCKCRDYMGITEL